jgi:hypothetical protein
MSDPRPEPHYSLTWAYWAVLFFTNYAYNGSSRENKDGGCYPIPEPINLMEIKFFIYPSV